MTEKNTNVRPHTKLSTEKLCRIFYTLLYSSGNFNPTNSNTQEEFNKWFLTQAVEFCYC